MLKKAKKKNRCIKKVVKYINSIGYIIFCFDFNMLSTYINEKINYGKTQFICLSTNCSLEMSFCFRGRGEML